MSFPIQSGEPEVDLAASSSSSAVEGAWDSGSIGAVPERLSGDLPIRQERVDAFRSQIKAGTYKVNAHALAKAMFENLFRS